MRGRLFDNVGTMVTISKSRSWTLCLLFFVLAVTWTGSPSGQMNGLAVSPNGKLIVVTYEKGDSAFIYEVSVDTGSATRLTKAATGWESSPSFSPDGKRIAYLYSPGNGAHSRIVIGDIDGSDLHPWSTSGTDDFRPLLAPDNKTIILARSDYYGSYSPIAQPHQHDWSFYAADFDGTHVRQLTNEHFYEVSAVSVSPDTRAFMFVSVEDKGDVIEIHSLEDPAKPKQILRPHLPHQMHPASLLNCPNYMPDGKSVLFMAASDGRHGYDYDVYRMDFQTGTTERLTEGNGYATDLRVSADGRTAVFLKWRSDWHRTPVESAIYLLDLQSHKLTLLKVSGLN
jgi:Tol biopolymer transport system component